MPAKNWSCMNNNPKSGLDQNIFYERELDHGIIT